MSTQTKPYISSEEYLAIERQAEYKSEYYDGEIFAMSGASRRHNLIVGNIYASIHRQVRKRACEVYANDMRVKVSATGLYTYPDISIVCGKPQFEDEELDTLLNPNGIIEVLSKSTQDYDRGTKFEHYRTINSLSNYLLIAQDKIQVIRYSRQSDNTWLFSEYKSLSDKIHIDTIDCEISLEDIFEKVSIGIEI